LPAAALRVVDCSKILVPDIACAYFFASSPGEPMREGAYKNTWFFVKEVVMDRPNLKARCLCSRY